MSYDCDNLLSEEILEYLYDKEITALAYKLGETDLRNPEDVINMFVEDLVTPTPILDEHGIPNEDGLCLPRKVKSFTVYAKLEEDENESKDFGEMSLQDSSSTRQSIPGFKDTMEKDDTLEKEYGEIGEEAEGEEEMEMDFGAPEEQEPEEEVEEIHGEPLFNVPGVWSPLNQKGHAILMYLYFRQVIILIHLI